MTIYHVVPSGDGWKVKKENGLRASSSHRKKSAAVNKAKSLARTRNGSVVIHGRNGMIQNEYSYGR